ncbi:porin [Oceanimonas sp. CHS3-5]|uniref:porin n=1 Tax=Oceanimonas sp. CHS3-5 TaxID=3068186 RepID=UPI00273DA028|nr:porin [Oceanimonas sp. CHS3-5]MDP5293298.1 porin [Oceanimonas sp. CHS3-5]
MTRAILSLLFFTSSAMAVTWNTDDHQQVLELHGKIQQEFGALRYQPGYKAESFGGDTMASLGLSGAGRLNADLILIGELSWDLVNDSRYGDQIYSDEAWLGVRIKDDLELTVGRSDSTFNQLRDKTDVFNLFGGNAYAYLVDGTLDDHLKLTWASDGWDLRAGYAFNDANKQDNNDDTKAQYGGSLGYQAQNGLGAVVAYENKREGDPNSDVSNMAVGLSYQTPGGFYAAVTRGRTDFQNNWQVFSLKDNRLYSMRRVDYWESVLSYSYEKVAFGVGYSRQSMRENTHLHWVDEYIFATEYYLMPKAKIYAEFLLNNMDDQDNLYGVGLQYYF